MAILFMAVSRLSKYIRPFFFQINDGKIITYALFYSNPDEPDTFGRRFIIPGSNTLGNRSILVASKEDSVNFQITTLPSEEFMGVYQTANGVFQIPTYINYTGVLQYICNIMSIITLAYITLYLLFHFFEYSIITVVKYKKESPDNYVLLFPFINCIKIIIYTN